jgi:predicted TIM-barrel fold metal-dependent hydrolase
MFVIDAVTHANDHSVENMKAGRYTATMFESLYRSQTLNMPDQYRLSRDQFYRPMTAEALAAAIFLETPVDIAVYHTIPAWGIFRDLSPISIGMAIRDRHPGRMFLYGAASPLEGKKAIEDLERQVEEWGIIGLKLYPIDVIDGKMREFRMDDEVIMYPLLERCRELGVSTVAVHKAIPLGTSPMQPFHPGDVDYAARDFPELNFEIVHGGFAFLEETCRQVARFPNVYVNLESTTQVAIKQPRLFASILGQLLRWGGPDKLFWGSGCNATGHSRPALEAFARFEMPPDLIEGFGYSSVTREVKQKILATNYAAVHALSVDDLAAGIADDEISREQARGLRTPWSGHQVELAAS